MIQFRRKKGVDDVGAATPHRPPCRVDLWVGQCTCEAEHRFGFRQRLGYSVHPGTVQNAPVCDPHYGSFRRWFSTCLKYSTCASRRFAAPSERFGFERLVPFLLTTL